MRNNEDNSKIDHEKMPVALETGKSKDRNDKERAFGDSIPG